MHNFINNAESLAENADIAEKNVTQKTQKTRNQRSTARRGKSKRRKIPSGA